MKIIPTILFFISAFLVMFALIKIPAEQQRVERMQAYKDRKEYEIKSKTAVSMGFSRYLFCDAEREINNSFLTPKSRIRITQECTERWEEFVEKFGTI